MTAYSRLADALDRIAAVTSITRTRSEDSVRREVNGSLSERVVDVVERLEAVATKLEATIS